MLATSESRFSIPMFVPMSSRWKGILLRMLFTQFGHFFKLLAIKEFETDPVNAMWNMWKKHQKEGMFWMRTFSMNLVFVGDHDTLHYLFNHPDVQGRFDPKFASVLKAERELPEDQVAAGVIISEGKVWQEQRRYALRTLRDFGFGKAGMEDLINEEVRSQDAQRLWIWQSWHGGSD